VKIEIECFLPKSSWGKDFRIFLNCLVENGIGYEPQLFFSQPYNLIIAYFFKKGKPLKTLANTGQKKLSTD